MASPVNTWNSFEAIGNREDLSDAIYDISPTETPFVSNIARTSATSTAHEWQTGSIDAATVQAYFEGDDAAADAANATVRLVNDTQIFRKVISVSGTQRAVRSAGRADEYEYQLMQKGRALKTNIEKTALGQQGRSGATTTATARQMAGVATWLSANKVHFASTSTTPGSGATLVIGNVAGVTVTTATQLQAPLNTVIQQVWSAGGDPGIIMCNAATKQRLSNLNGIATLYRDVPADQQGRIVAGADWYTSDFGNHAIVPNRFMPNSNTAGNAQVNALYVLDMDYWAIAELRPMTTEPLAKTGDSDRAMLLCEATLEARNGGASGKVSDFIFA